LRETHVYTDNSVLLISGPGQWEMTGEDNLVGGRAVHANQLHT
jgi:hypothetical protein